MDVTFGKNEVRKGSNKSTIAADRRNEERQTEKRYEEEVKKDLEFYGLNVKDLQDRDK